MVWVAVLLAISGEAAHAWGRLGHRVISRLAKKHMTEKARDALAELLDDTETIADASLWADENRRRLPKTAPWHYVNVPLDEPAYDAKWSADDPKKGCVVDKINEFRKVVKDKSKPIEERRFALRFLINETVRAFETNVSLWRCSEEAGRDTSERRAGLEMTNVDTDLALGWGRPPPPRRNSNAGRPRNAARQRSFFRSAIFTRPYVTSSLPDPGSNKSSFGRSLPRAAKQSVSRSPLTL